MRNAVLRAVGVLAILWLSTGAVLAQSDRAKIEDFLDVTGFDVALESIRLSAGTAPMMLGLDKDAFGAQWQDLTADIFDTEAMHDIAVEMLSRKLEPEELAHARDFYATDLGQRIVAAENASHMKDDDTAKSEAGQAIVAGLVRHGSDRLETLKRMTAASGSIETSVHAVHEIQVRFLVAADAAGVMELRMDEAGLRAFFAAKEGDLARAIQVSALSGAAYTYQAFSDAEVEAYAQALEHPVMQSVYDVMNAVQYEVMANRFEVLATRMATLRPSTDL